MADQSAIRKYRPSNGTEGEIFTAVHCFQCERDNYDLETGEGEPCEILGRTMVHSRDDDEYPSEWTFDQEGNPTCTAFITKDEPVPIRCTRTNDMFGEFDGRQ